VSNSPLPCIISHPGDRKKDIAKILQKIFAKTLNSKTRSKISEQHPIKFNASKVGLIPINVNK
jgi:hypothetical protein